MSVDSKETSLKEEKIKEEAKKKAPGKVEAKIASASNSIKKKLSPSELISSFEKAQLAHGESTLIPNTVAFKLLKLSI